MGTIMIRHTTYDIRHTTISKLILTAAATGIGISAVPYAQADGNGATPVRKLMIKNPIDDDDNKQIVEDTYDPENAITYGRITIGYDGNGTLITNISRGGLYSGSTDAVTGDQLYQLYLDVPEKIEKKLEEFIQDLPGKFNESGSDVKIKYSETDKQLTLTLSEDLKKKINNISNSGGKGEKGEKGDKGENGKSAYEIWKSLDTGKRADKTEQDFIDSLGGGFTRTEESDGTMLTAKGKITNERPNGEVRISGLAAGRISPSSSDAVNGAQLFEAHERISSIEQKVNKLDKSMNGGIAKAGAVALLPQPTYAGRSMVSASTAHYNGEQALAIGYSRLSDNGKVILKAGTSFNFSGNNTKKPLFGAAVGYQW